MRPTLMLIGISLASFLAAILAFELWDDYRFDLRRFPQGHDGEIAFAVPRLFGIRVSTDATVYKTPFGATERIRILAQHDQFGMRSARAISEFPHRRNIALLGDSFTWGAENLYADTLQHQMELAFPDANVLNFAISGSNSNYFSAMATAFLSRVGRKLDVVVVGIYTDLSIGDIPRIAAVDRYGDQVILDQIAVSRRTYEALMMSRWRRLAVSANTTMRRLSSTYNRIFPPRASSKFAVPMTHAPDGALEIWRERVLANLHALSAATKLPPSRLIVWLIPSNHDLHSIWQAGRTGSAVPDYVQRADRFWTETARRFSFAEFEMVDARNAIQQLFLNEGRYPYSVSGHFRPIAYRTVAQLIVPRVALALGNHQTYP